MSGNSKVSPELELVELTDKQKAARSSRNKAIALCLVAMIGIFYAATISRFGSIPDDAKLVKIESK